MNKVTAEIYAQRPGKYILVSGREKGAPTCPYGNAHEWVGYDTETKQHIRFTKSVYKRLIKEMEVKKIKI